MPIAGIFVLMFGTLVICILTSYHQLTGDYEGGGP